MDIISIGEWIGIGILSCLYVGIQVWIYKKEYGEYTNDNQKNTKD